MFPTRRLALALVVFFTMSTAAARAADPPAVSIGVNPTGSGPLGAAIDAYTAKAGAAPRMVMWYQSFSEPLFYGSQVQDVASRGQTPLITWAPELSDGSGVPLADIASGAHDDRIRAAAQLAASWGKPLLVRFAHEMNLSGSPYGPGRNGNVPAAFVAAWRHVVTVFRAERATNVRWVWTPNVDCGGGCPFESFYPGDDWVDWVGLDGYNYSSISGVPWMSLSQVFGSSYDAMERLTSKPLMIAETSSAEGGGDKAAWIRDAFENALPVRMPAVRAVIWFDRVKETDWRIDSSAASLAAYRAAVAAPRYAGSDVVNPPASAPTPTPAPPPSPAVAVPAPAPPPAPLSVLTPAPAPAPVAVKVPAQTRPTTPPTRISPRRRRAGARSVRCGRDTHPRGHRRHATRRCSPARHRASHRRVHR